MVIFLKKIFGVLSQLGADATDSDEVRQEKIMIVAASIFSISTAFLYGVIYTLQGKLIVGGIFGGGVVVFSFFFVNFVRTRNISRLRFNIEVQQVDVERIPHKG